MLRNSTEKQVFIIFIKAFIPVYTMFLPLQVLCLDLILVKYYSLVTKARHCQMQYIFGVLEHVVSIAGSTSLLRTGSTAYGSPLWHLGTELNEGVTQTPLVMGWGWLNSLVTHKV